MIENALKDDDQRSVVLVESGLPAFQVVEMRCGTKRTYNSTTLWHVVAPLLMLSAVDQLLVMKLVMAHVGSENLLHQPRCQENPIIILSDSEDDKE
jgi:hypothetical protein